MELQEGKKYKARNGEVHGPLYVDPQYKDRFTDEMGSWYGDDGRYWAQGPHCPFSLIEECE